MVVSASQVVYSQRPNWPPGFTCQEADRKDGDGEHAGAGRQVQLAEAQQRLQTVAELEKELAHYRHFL